MTDQEIVEIVSENLRKWFNRQGGAGKSKGWVDCNTCRKDPKTGRKKCKSCGRQKGEKRAKYPACRPTPSACSQKGKGKTWGKKSEIVDLVREVLAEKKKKKKKKDRCHRKADSVYGAKTSAYKSGAIVRCRSGKIWKKK